MYLNGIAKSAFLIHLLNTAIFYITKTALRSGWRSTALSVFQSLKIGQNALKDIAAAAPEALIPSYHREISGLVEQKNRSSYKEAVKQLKKLRTLYKKAKKQDVWNRFMEQFSARYKRLRAFQEELKKGKLIDGES